MSSVGHGNKFLDIGSCFTWKDLQGKTVILKVVKAEDEFCCNGCWFFKRQHCPESWACGKYRRKDGLKVIFTKQGVYMCELNGIEKRLLENDDFINNLTYDGLLQEKHYLVSRMEEINERKRDLCKQYLLLESLCSKISKRIKVLKKNDNEKKAQNNKDYKRFLLLTKIQDILNELNIDPKKISEEIEKIKGCKEESSNENNN